MPEVQSHGFTFEKWVRDSLFGGYSGNYTQEWDIPPEANSNVRMPAQWRKLPVSVKAEKFGAPIGLGDIRRQRQINTPFLMIVGFWSQRTPTEKWFDDIGLAYFSVETWNRLWGSLKLEDIDEIDRRIKDKSLSYIEARAEAAAWRKKHVQEPDGQKHIVVNPKIDSKSQRRIQCSLPFDAFWQCVGRKPLKLAAPSLLGFIFENPVKSEPRTFNKGKG